MIAVGRISRSVGLKGEMSLSILSSAPDRFDDLGKVWIGADEQQALPHDVIHVRSTHAAVVIKVEGIDSRSAADTRRGQLVFVAEQDAIVPPPGSYFIHDLIGMDVVTEAGDAVGPIRDVLEMPANDVWVVAAKGREVLIPAIKDVIRSVDVQKRTVVIRPLEGLLE